MAIPKPEVDTLQSYWLADGSGLKYYEFAGNSSANKPVKPDMAFGCIFHEVDTAKIWAYDRSTSTWYTQISLGGDGT